MVSQANREPLPVMFPPQELGETTYDLPQPPEPEPEPEPVLEATPVNEPEPEPRVEPPPPEAEPAPPEPAREQTASRGANPDPTSPGGENINLQLPGVLCPTPEYCNNIIRQIYRHFRRPRGLQAEADIFFRINRDGSISGLRLLSSTGGPAFRLAVMEAVEQAGIARAFGPLPDVYGADQLPVSFYFRPAR
jgi:protein TonB